jgi:hypothetical protein
VSTPAQARRSRAGEADIQAVRREHLRVQLSSPSYIWALWEEGGWARYLVRTTDDRGLTRYVLVGDIDDVQLAVRGHSAGSNCALVAASVVDLDTGEEVYIDAQAERRIGAPRGRRRR